MFLSKKFKLFFSFFIFLSFNNIVNSENRFSWGALKEKRQSVTYQCKNVIKKSKNFALRNVIYPTLIKWEELKEEGISKEDVAKVIVPSGLIFFAGYLYKKTGCSTKVKNLLIDNQKNIGLGFLGSAALLSSYLIYKKYNNNDEKIRKLNEDLDLFLSSLSDEQHESIINSTYLFNEVLNGFDNPKTLLNCTDFIMLLDQDQKDRLRSIILRN